MYKVWPSILMHYNVKFVFYKSVDGTMYVLCICKKRSNMKRSTWNTGGIDREYGG